MIPSFKEYFYPFMLLLSDKNSHKISDIRTFVASYFKLTSEEIHEKTKAGGNRHDGRCSWTARYLKKMDLIQSEVRGHYKITGKGINLLETEGENFSLDTIRDLEGYEQLQKKSDGGGYWVPGHWTSTGRYIPGYISKWKWKGCQRRLTKEELDDINKNPNKPKSQGDEREL